MTTKELYRVIRDLEDRIANLPLDNLELNMEALEQARALFQARPVERRSEAVVAYAASKS
ncbi:hypothetical protein [Sinorhizobium meliloti]|uniref:hypothetical protein n=1 Tax=Rhizobium meliloti TaxID=382 RepID=UPI003D64785E